MTMVEFRIHGVGQFDGTRKIGPCAWPHFDLLTVLSGKVSIELQHRDRLELAKDQSILIYPQTHFEGESITRRSMAAVQHFHVRDEARTLGDAHPVGRLPGRQGGYEVLQARQPQTLSSDVRRAVQMANRPDMSAQPHVREAMLTLILGQLSPRDVLVNAMAGESSIDFAKLTRWITANLNQQITLDDMAAVADRSTSHFRAAFAHHFGQSPGVFVRKACHLEAARLLRETRMPIKQIALKLGYDDIAHFYRFFQRIARLTPKAYRDRHQVSG